jgi:hypothetical protein
VSKWIFVQPSILFPILHPPPRKHWLTHQRVLQKKRHEVNSQRSDIHEKLLSDIKVRVYESVEVVLHLQSQSMPNIHETQKAVMNEGDDCIDLGLTCQSSTASTNWNKSSRWKAMARKRGDVIFHLRTPSWSAFGSHCFDVCMRRSLYEGSIRILKYRVVSYDAPIMQHIGKGNIARIQEMFKMGIASPNDRDTRGLTLLGVGLSIFVLLKAELIKNRGL